jgi:hypothetical protein
MDLRVNRLWRAPGLVGMDCWGEGGSGFRRLLPEWQARAAVDSLATHRPLLTYNWGEGNLVDALDITLLQGGARKAQTPGPKRRKPAAAVEPNPKEEEEPVAETASGAGACASDEDRSSQDTLSDAGRDDSDFVAGPRRNAQVPMLPTLLVCGAAEHRPPSARRGRPVSTGNPGSCDSRHGERAFRCWSGLVWSSGQARPASLCDTLPSRASRLRQGTAQGMCARVPAARPDLNEGVA